MGELRGTIPDAASKIRAMPWIADGISREEFNAVRGLFRLVNDGYSADFIDQPWVVNGRNYPVLSTLWRLAANKPEKLAKIMSHPTISDGMSHQEAKIITVLTPGSDPDLVDKLLDPAQVTLEERTIHLPLAGETELSMIRTLPGRNASMDSLEHAVRRIEDFMGLPFPQRQVIYHFVDSPGGGGINHHGAHVSILASEQGWSEEVISDIISHEASHYYWQGRAPTWLVEGAALFMEAAVKDTLNGPLEGEGCDLAQNIVDLEDLNLEPGSFDHYDCNYSLGELLYRDLYSNMDETAFRQAFRRLYLHTLYSVSDECDDHATTFCHVKEAFLAYAPGDTSSVVEDVFARRYYGTDSQDAGNIFQGASIWGVVKGSEGRLPGDISLTPERGGQGPLVEIAPDGTFSVDVEPGSYILVVRVKVGTEWVFVGWYDGIGGITTDRTQAFQIIVGDNGTGEIEITLPSDAEGLLCPPGYYRWPGDGQCYES